MELELQVAKTLQNTCWRVAHGAYYVDPVEKKPREIDVRALQLWIKDEEGFKYEFLCRLRLLVECKTIEGYHIVFPRAFPSGPLVEDAATLRYWIGEDSSIRSRLCESLLKRGTE